MNDMAVILKKKKGRILSFLDLSWLQPTTVDKEPNKLLRLSERRQGVLEEMVTLAQPLPEYEILLSIPGIAEITATSIIGELGDIRRFHSANQINAFIGIDLRHYESGEFLAKEHITKRGNPYARKILFKCIHNIASPSHTNPCYITDFYENR